MKGAGLVPVRVWDLPVRLVHWSFVALIPALWWTAENERFQLHGTLGLVMLALVVFRILWGIFGSTTARFSGFVRGPGAIRRYLAGLRSGIAAPIVGHNPLGALSVMALLGLLALQVGLGVFAQDSGADFFGPLNSLVGWDTAKALSEAHGFVFNLILALVAIHIAAILYYRFIKRDNLVSPMITGRRVFETSVAAPRIAPLWLALVCAALAAALAVWVSWGFPPFATPFPWDRPVQQVPDASSYM